jgi:nitrogen-specific signal transduction histidine kinase
MPHTPKFQVDSPEGLESVMPDLTELCRIHDISLDLIERSTDLDDLLERILEEYEARLSDLPNDALDMRADSLSLATAKKLRALTMFASQAVALKARAEEIEKRHRLEKLNEVLKTLSVLAHKINNPLTALLGRAQLLRAYPDADPKVKKTVSVIEESATRIADLIKELAGVVKEGKQEAVEQLLAMDGECEPPEKRS